MRVIKRKKGNKTVWSYENHLIDHALHCVKLCSLKPRGGGGGGGGFHVKMKEGMGVVRLKFLKTPLNGNRISFDGHDSNSWSPILNKYIIQLNQYSFNNEFES